MLVCIVNGVEDALARMHPIFRLSDKHYSHIKTIRFPTDCLRVLLLLNILAVESLKYEIRWNPIKYNHQSYFPFLSKGLNGKVTFLSYAIIFPQTTPLSSNNWSHSLVSNLLITTLTKICKIAKNIMHSHIIFFNTELF